MKLAIVAVVCFVAGIASAQTVPDIKPGDTCEKLRASYGNETSINLPAHNWKRDDVVITVLVKPDGPCVAGSVNFNIAAGHTLQTRDGVVLGKDSLTETRLKLKGRIDASSFMSVRGGGKTYGQIIALPTPDFPFKTTYTWLLNSAIADKLQGPPTLANFTNEPVFLYSIDPPDYSQAVR